MRKGKGLHLIIDCKGLPFDVCMDDKRLLKTVTDALTKGAANIISTARYRFGHNSPPGCTIFVMLDESHFSIHTYAEQGQMAIDIFTCGNKVDSKLIFNKIKKALVIKNYTIQKIERFKNG